MTASLHYEIVDVFTDTPFTGNPLAVVLDADDLPTAALQALAREFHLSETAFPLRPDVSGADYRLRIFTPEVELPFAGHPSVGAAWVLATLGRVALSRPSTVVHQSCGAGTLPLRIDADAAGGPGRVELTGGIPSYGEELDPQPLLSAVGLAARDLDGPLPRVCGTGIEVTHLGVRRDAVDRAVPDPGELRRLPDHGASAELAVAAWDPVHRMAYTRVFAGGLGVPEDPATGSAATSYGVWLAVSGLVDGDAETRFVVEQGVALGRPSRLEGTVVTRGGAPVECRVAGSIVAVARGEIRRP